MESPKLKNESYIEQEQRKIKICQGIDGEGETLIEVKFK